MTAGGNKDLRYDTWRFLARLVAENISEEHLSRLMKVELGRNDDRLDGLNQAQADAIIDALIPLAKLRKMLLEAARRIEGVTPEQADSIVIEQCNTLATMMVRQANFDLFGRQPTSVKPTIAEIDA